MSTVEMKAQILEVASKCCNYLSYLHEMGVINNMHISYEVDQSFHEKVNFNMEEKFWSVLDNLAESLKEIKKLEVIKVDTMEDTMAKSSRTVNPDLVQIQVDRKVIDKRIEAFTTRKRKEIDDWNIHEFCSMKKKSDEEQENEESSCARVDSVFVPRSGGSSHVKVSRVVNEWGPMTHFMRPSLQSTTNKLAERDEKSDMPESVEERLRNMESHLKLKSDVTGKQDMFVRLKELEDRILFLEGISPEYFQMVALRSPTKLKTVEKETAEEDFKDWSLSEIDERIKTLQNRLTSTSSPLKLVK